MSRPRVFEWQKRFKSGREEVEDGLRSGRPSTTKIDKNIVRVKQMVRSDCRLTIRMIADNLDLNRESVRNILLHDLGMRKVCAKLVPKILSEDQKQRRVDFCKDMLENIGVGDMGAGGAIALPFVKFGTVASKIRATQNIFRAVFDHSLYNNKDCG